MQSIKSLFGIIKQINYIMTAKQKRGAVWVFLSMIACSVLELLGVSVIYPFLQLMMNEEDVRSKWYINWIYVLFPDISFNGVLITMCIGIIVVYLVKNASALFCSYVQSKYANAFHRELSTTMLQSFMKRPYEFFVNTNSAKISQSINGNTYSTFYILQNLFQFIAESITVLFIGLYLIYTDWIVATGACVLAFACFLFIVLTFKRRLKKAGKAMTDAQINTSKACFQAIGGIKEISVMDRRQWFVDEYGDAARDMEGISNEYLFLSACPDRILEGICIGGFIAIACVRIVMGADPKEFVPVLGSFAMGAFKLLPSMSKMSNRINTIVYEQNRLEMCCNDLKAARAFEEEQSKLIIESDDSDDNTIEFQNEIEIKNVYWKYRNSANNTLEGVNLTVHKGEAVALIGASGAGKTTLADVMLGLFRPQMGSVFMDGVDIASIPRTWARTVGYVPQAVYLIDDTIRANIAFGLPKDEVSDERIWQSLEEAQLDEFVRSLPNGLETLVGERGVRFSGGQKQRVAIARALYANPPILILDEATSALDTETETAVMESIESLLGRKTIIIIAHRLTTIRNCDKVYEVIDGKAVERDKDTVIGDQA